jgi:hypothetical protein
MVDARICEQSLVILLNEQDECGERDRKYSEHEKEIRHEISRPRRLYDFRETKDGEESDICKDPSYDLRGGRTCTEPTTSAHHPLTEEGTTRTTEE